MTKINFMMKCHVSGICITLMILFLVCEGLTDWWGYRLTILRAYIKNMELAEEVITEEDDLNLYIFNMFLRPSYNHSWM